MPIKPFGGNFCNWSSFDWAFTSLAEYELELCEKRKFHLLKQLLCDEALELIALDENFTQAWDSLEKRYNKPRKIMQSRLKALFELPTIRSNSFKELRDLAEQARMHVRVMERFKEPVKHWDSFLVYLISNKLGARLKHNWEKTLEDDETPTFNQLISFINRQAVSMRRETSDVETVSTNISPTICVLCTGLHKLSDCDEFLRRSERERHRFVKDQALCFVCFEETHTTNDCPDGNCEYCYGSHNKLLHFERKP